MVLANGPSCDRGNRTLRWSQFCDGIIDCYDRSDEEGQFCKLCVNNLYSCPPNDDIRCDLACQILHYVPCQTIQDRRACQNIQKNVDGHSFFEKFKFYISNRIEYVSESSLSTVLIAIILFLLVSIGIIILIRYFQQRSINPLAKSSKISNDCHHPIETDTLSSHIYEQCYEPSSCKLPQKYPYYEHVV